MLRYEFAFVHKWEITFCIVTSNEFNWIDILFSIFSNTEKKHTKSLNADTSRAVLELTWTDGYNKL